VTSPVGPPPEVLAQLRQRGPLQAVLTREETPVFGEPGVAVEGEPTRVATPSGLAAERQGEPAPVEGQRPEQRPSALVGPVEGQRPEQRPSALVAAVSSLELVLDGDEVDVDVPTGRQERPALPPGGPPRDDLPLPADTAETALEAQPTRVVREPPAAPSARSGPPTPGPEVVPPSAPRRWLGWLLVALTGLGLGGGAALWLLVRGRRASYVSRPAPVAQGAPDAGRDSAPSRDQQTPDAVAPDSVSTQRARPVRRRHRRAGRPRPRVKR
jgi:hypothetical protein